MNLPTFGLFAVVLFVCINIDSIASATIGSTASSIASTNAKKNKKPHYLSSEAIGNGIKKFKKLFHRNPKANNDLSKLKEEIQKLIDGEEQIGQSSLHQKSMANPEAIRLMLEKQERLLALIIENFLGNIPNEADFGNGLRNRVLRMAERDLRMEKAASVMIGGGENQQQGNEEKKLEEVAEVLDVVENLGLSNENEKSSVASSPGLNLSRWKEGHNKSKNKWLAKLKKHYNKYKAGLMAGRMQVVHDKGEMTKHIRDKAMGLAMTETTSAFSKLGMSVMERTHCVGFYKLLKSFKKPSKKNVEERAKFEAKQSEDDYRKRGEIFFNVFLMLHQFDLSVVPALNVDKILNNPDKNARNCELDKVMAKLKRFSMSSLLVPFSQNNNISIEELVAIRALLTDKRLVEAMAERFSSQSSSAPSTDRSQSKGKARAKRGVVGKEDLKAVGVGVTIGTLVLAPPVGVALLAVWAMIDWCWL